MHGHNRLRTALLLAGTTGLLLLAGQVAGGPRALAVASVVAVGVCSFACLCGDSIALRAMRARPVGEAEQPALHRIVRELCTAARQPVPRLYLSPTAAPNAFATGRSPRHAAVCCTEGMLAALTERELRGVLGHELSHVYHRDTLLASVAAALAGAVTVLGAAALLLSGQDEDRPNPLVMLVMLVLGPLAAVTIQLAVSRSREFEADAAAARLTGDPLALAAALRKLELGARAHPLPAQRRLVNTGHLMIVSPFRAEGMARLFATHPPTAQRLARLEAMAGYDR